MHRGRKKRGIRGGAGKKSEFTLSCIISGNIQKDDFNKLLFGLSKYHKIFRDPA